MKAGEKVQVFPSASTDWELLLIVSLILDAIIGVYELKIGAR